MGKKKIAIFDFDGTLTKGDSLFPFLKYCFGIEKVLLGFCLLSPFLIAYVFKIVSNDYAKRKVIRYFFKNKSISYIQSKAENFVERKISSMLRKNILNRLRWHQQKGHKTILISASLDVYIKLIGQKYGFDLIEGTQLKVNDNFYTGEIEGNNCFGKEKLNRLNKIFKDSLQKSETYGYGDGKGDAHFLAICKYRYGYKALKHI